MQRVFMTMFCQVVCFSLFSAELASFSALFVRLCHFFFFTVYVYMCHKQVRSRDLRSSQKICVGVRIIDGRVWPPVPTSDLDRPSRQA
jgi:hypothetical protein